MEGFIMKKKPFITVETENLAVPEVHDILR